jgi:CubicO group peptidase (beta-lactamase class C family)
MLGSSLGVEGVPVVLRVEVPSELVRGDVDEGYGAVADAFRRNFARGEEIGAACAIYQDGRAVVDLWGGYRDGRSRSLWEADTMVSVFSATKGMSGAAMAVAHARGLFDLAELVASYWPEFGTNGKETITVGQLLAHQAGLAVLDRKVTLELVADHDQLGAILAQQRPLWPPGTRHGYHAVTLGWYESQLLSRVDPQGRTLGRFFAEEVATPLEAEFYIGLPDDVPDERVATIHAFKPPEMLLNLGKMPRRVLLGMLDPRGVLSRSMRCFPELMQPDAWNRRETLRVEAPSINGTGEPRAIARVYGALATGSTRLGITAPTMSELEQASAPTSGPRDVALGLNASYAMGFLKPSPTMGFGSSSRAFGAPGGGGSLGFADPDAAVGYAYAMNRLGFHMPVDPRELAIRDAFYTSIGAPPQHA